MIIRKLTKVYETMNVFLTVSLKYIAFYLSKVIGHQQSEQGIIVSNNAG